MIDIKNEMAERVDHPAPYLVDLVGRLVKERDFLVDLFVSVLNQVEAKEGGDQTSADLRKWVINQMENIPGLNQQEKSK